MCLRVMTAVDACPADHVKCATSDECVAERYICDGQQDCEDGSDEPPECGMCRNVVVVVVGLVVGRISRSSCDRS